MSVELSELRHCLARRAELQSQLAALDDRIAELSRVAAVDGASAPPQLVGHTCKYLFCSPRRPPVPFAHNAADVTVMAEKVIGQLAEGLLAFHETLTRPPDWPGTMNEYTSSDDFGDTNRLEGAVDDALTYIDDHTEGAPTTRAALMWILAEVFHADLRPNAHDSVARASRGEPGEHGALESEASDAAEKLAEVDDALDDMQDEIGERWVCVLESLQRVVVPTSPKSPPSKLTATSSAAGAQELSLGTLIAHLQDRDFPGLTGFIAPFQSTTE